MWGEIADRMNWIFDSKKLLLKKIYKWMGFDFLLQIGAFVMLFALFYCAFFFLLLLLIMYIASNRNWKYMHCTCLKRLTASFHIDFERAQYEIISLIVCLSCIQITCFVQTKKKHQHQIWPFVGIE